MNIAQLLVDQAHHRGESPALQEIRRGHLHSLSFAQLNDRSAQVATLLRNLDLGPGDRVLIFQPMSIPLYLVLLACFRLGVVASFLDPSAPSHQIAACCHRIQPRALIGSPKAQLLRLRHSALGQIPHAMVTTGIGFPCSTPLRSAWDLAPETRIWEATSTDPALLTFTSGSTGTPKAAVRTHGLLLAQHQALIEAIHLQPGQLDLSTLPIFALANLASGLTTLIAVGDLRRPGAIRPGPVVNQILRYQPARAAASPAFFERLITYCQQRDQHLPSLRQIYTGGAPVFPSLLDRLGTIAPQAQRIALYGSTEAEPIAHIRHNQIQPSDHQRMISGGGLLTGPPVPQIELRILPSHGDAPIPPLAPSAFDQLQLPVNHPGEIIVTGDHVLQGYWDGIGDQQTKLKVGDRIWHRTGDAGYLDPQGRLWLLGRDQARIEDHKGILYPFAVESAADQIPEIERTALIQHKGRRILVVQCGRSHQTPGFRSTLQQILTWAELDHILWTQQISVDRRHNAKVDYPALRQWISTQAFDPNTPAGG